MDESPTPPPPVVVVDESSERGWCMAAHLSALAGYAIPFGNLLGPFVVWQIKKDTSSLVTAHAKAALNFQISLLIYCFIAWLLIFVLIGVPLLVLLAVGNLVCIIIAAVRANEGQKWNYPASLKLLK